MNWQVLIIAVVSKTRKKISKYNSSSTCCNLLISFYSFFNSNILSDDKRVLDISNLTGV